MIRGQELLIILLIVVVVFGASRLPGIARSLGSSAKEFRKGLEDGSSEGEEALTDETSDSDQDPA